MSLPTYTYHIKSGYYFRIRVPFDLKGIVGKTEFRYSLRSGFYKEAIQKAQKIATHLRRLFAEVRMSTRMFTREMIDGLVRAQVKAVLEEDEECRALADTPSTIPTENPTRSMSPYEACVLREDDAQAYLNTLERCLAMNDHSLMESTATNLLTANNLQDDNNILKLLTRKLMVAYRDIANLRVLRASGDFSQADNDVVSALSNSMPSVSHTPQQAPVQDLGLKFSEVAEKLRIEKLEDKKWKEGSTDYKGSIHTVKIFIQTMGDLRMGSITREVMRLFKRTLQKLPVPCKQ